MSDEPSETERVDAIIAAVAETIRQAIGEDLETDDIIDRVSATLEAQLDESDEDAQDEE